MQELVTLVQSGHRQIEEAVSRYMAAQPTTEASDSAGTQELGAGELTIGGATVRVAPQTEQTNIPHAIGPRSPSEQALFDKIIDQYRLCGMLITEPEKEEKPPKDEPDDPPPNAVDRAREEYARRSAIRGFQTIGFGERHSKESVADARKQYEDRKKELLEHERETALAAGVDAEMFDRYAPIAALREAWKLARDVSNARKLASHKWSADDHGVIALDETQPLGKINRVFFGKKLWRKTDPDTKLSTQEAAALTLRRAAIIGALPVAITAGALLTPLEAGYLVAGTGITARWLGRKILDYKPGYKPGRKALRVLSLEAAHEKELFATATSVRENEDSRPKRKLYNDAELVKEFAYAMVHAEPGDESINSLDVRIANMIDEETDKRLMLGRSRPEPKLDPKPESDSDSEQTAH